MPNEEEIVDKMDLSQTAKEPTVEVTVEYLNALRKAVGLRIDPETAEVQWIYALTLDPYGDHPDVPEEYRQVGRGYFARSPGSDIWIDFGDLPEAIRNALWERRRNTGKNDASNNGSIPF